MSLVYADQIISVSAGETRNFALDYSYLLDAGESLTGTPTLAQVDGLADLTLSDAAVSGTTLTILGNSVAAGEAVTGKVVIPGGATSGYEYQIKITVGTDASPAQTFVRGIKLTVR